ncbi:MAG: hypothetical protein ACP5FP_04525 [Desulfuromonadaceae bacterium]|jgi:hypothetical protein
MFILLQINARLLVLSTCKSMYYLNHQNRLWQVGFDLLSSYSKIEQNRKAGADASPPGFFVFSRLSSHPHLALMQL